jgi:hypothetical protein
VSEQNHSLNFKTSVRHLTHREVDVLVTRVSVLLMEEARSTVVGQVINQSLHSDHGDPVGLQATIRSITVTLPEVCGDFESQNLIGYSRKLVSNSETRGE